MSNHHDNNPPIKVSEEQRLKILAASAELRATAAEFARANEKLGMILEKIDRKKRLRTQLKTVEDLREAHSFSEMKWTALLKEVQDGLGLASLEGLKLDPATGELTKQTSSCEPEEASPSPSQA